MSYERCFGYDWVMMSFKILGLPSEPFAHLYGLPDDELARRGATRYVADAKPGFPDRVELRDAEPGERVLLLNYEHQPAPTAFRASHAIFVLEGATRRYQEIDTIPDVFRTRTLSLRAFDGEGMMINATLTEGANAERDIEQVLRNRVVAYVHAHYAARGCYAARIERVS